MSRANKRSCLLGLGALLLIAFAMWARYASRTVLHHNGWNYLRSGIYIFLFSAWGFSIRIRIVQPQARRYLLRISALMVLWLLLRSVKFSVNNPDWERWLWYLYYVPMLLIPLLAAFVSLSLGKGEDFRLPGAVKLLYVPTVLLLLLVLTNDWHYSVFSFPAGVATDGDYRYGAGYYLVLGWELVCAVAAIVTMLGKCRIPHSRRVRWLPLVPLSLSVAYAVAYARGVRWVWVLAGDMTVTLCLMFAGIFESCIQCGLIPSNLGYDELLEATSLPVQITDASLHTRHVSAAMQEPLPPELLGRMQQDTLRLDGDTLLRRHPLRRGWVFWKEDLSELNALGRELELTRDELRDTGDVLAAENAQQARLLKLTEENRLYDMMEAQTARQIGMLRERLTQLQSIPDLARARELLGQVILLGTYIKRRNNLIFVGVQRGAISAQELGLCLNESVENLNLYGVDSKALVMGEGPLTIDQAVQTYDLFEAAVELGLETMTALLVSVRVSDRVEVHLCAAGDAPLEKLGEQFRDVQWERDEDGLQYVTRTLEKSGE